SVADDLYIEKDILDSIRDKYDRSFSPTSARDEDGNVIDEYLGMKMNKSFLSDIISKGCYLNYSNPVMMKFSRVMDNVFLSYNNRYDEINSTLIGITNVICDFISTPKEIRNETNETTREYFITKVNNIVDFHDYLNEITNNNIQTIYGNTIIRGSNGQPINDFSELENEKFITYRNNLSNVLIETTPGQLMKKSFYLKIDNNTVRKIRNKEYVGKDEMIKINITDNPSDATIFTSEDGSGDDLIFFFNKLINTGKKSVIDEEY